MQQGIENLQNYVPWYHFKVKKYDQLKKKQNLWCYTSWPKLYVFHSDPNKDTEDFLAIVCEDSGKVMLFDPIERSVHPKPAYTIADPSK